MLKMVDIGRPERAHDSLWVVNNLRGDSRKTVGMNMPDGAGGIIMVKIPCTFLPIDLVEQVSRKSVLESKDFRLAYQKRWISILDDSEAEAILGKPGAHQELERLRKEELERESALAEGYGTYADAGTMLNEAELAQAGVESQVNPRVEALMESLKTPTGDEVTVVNRMRSMRLNEEDRKFIHAEAEKGEYGSILDFLNE